MGKKSVNYESLATLPLFMGIDGATLSDFCESVCPEIVPVRSGTVIAAAGTDCRTLVIVTEGKIAATLADAKGLYTIEEHLQGKMLVEPQRLFGLHPTYTRTYTALSPCSLLTLPKSVVVSQLLDGEVFRFNFMNAVCTAAQQCETNASAMRGGSIERRFAEFVLRRVLRPVGSKEVRAKMTDLAALLATSRLSLSRSLRSMTARGLIETTRASIVIPALENLMAQTK